MTSIPHSITITISAIQIYVSTGTTLELLVTAFIKKVMPIVRKETRAIMLAINALFDAFIDRLLSHVSRAVKAAATISTIPPKMINTHPIELGEVDAT